MRSILVLLISFWTGIVSIAFAQSSTHEEQQASRKTSTSDTKQNKVAFTEAGRSIESGQEQQAERPDSATRQDANWSWKYLRVWGTFAFAFAVAFFTGLTWWTYHRIFATDECLIPWDFPLDMALIPSIENETQRLWLYGYIDYRDKFGSCHRAGYARMYDPKSVNLVFVTQDRYNYDCPKG